MGGRVEEGQMCDVEWDEKYGEAEVEDYLSGFGIDEDVELCYVRSVFNTWPSDRFVSPA